MYLVVRYMYNPHMRDIQLIKMFHVKLIQYCLSRVTSLSRSVIR